MNVHDLADQLEMHRFVVENESAFQESVAAVLSELNVAHRREVVLDARSRIDFLTAAGIGIECKIDDSPSAVVAQLFRYAAHSEVKALICLTPRARIVAGFPRDLRGKPLVGVAVWKGNL